MDTKGNSTSTATIEGAIRLQGGRIFELIEQVAPPSFFSKKGFYGTMMDWAMRDEHLKTQLFRFVDVLPALNSSTEIATHLKEYFGEEQVELPPALRLGLKASTGASWLVGTGMRSQVTSMARQFMLGDEPKEILDILRKLNDEGIAFTADILGEAVVSENEADRYAARYLELMDSLAAGIAKWSHECPSNRSSRGVLPALNLSVKLSALYSQIHPADPDTAVRQISERLRPILRRAKELGAFVNFDMESYALKNLTLRVFQSVFGEPEFTSGPACGIALQAYLKDCEPDLMALIGWAKENRRRPTIRLVKGAYWDYETVVAQQRHWPIPVFSKKLETDINFERLSVILLENEDTLDSAFATHNVRSIACVLAHAERLGVSPRSFEFQMLYGMAEPIKAAVLKLGCRLREYCPVGELLPGIAYFVRRLLENTSNEGFLANRFARGATRDALLEDPRESAKSIARNEPTGKSAMLAQFREPISPNAAANFRNEPPADFTNNRERQALQRAIETVRRGMGQRHPLIINGKPGHTKEWLPSRNPANQEEIVGYSAQGTLNDAEEAVAAAKRAQPKWSRIPAAQRAEVLEKVATLMRREKAALSALEILEAGKNWTEADADVAEAIDFCNFYSGIMREFGVARRTQSVAGESNFQSWWPRGVGVVIAPWNFPLAILAGMATAAIVGGNAVIIKPSDQTPIIAARFMELLEEAGLPSGVANLLTGPGGQVGAHLVAHAQIDFVAFTGSKEVGLKIWEMAGRTAPGQANLKRVVCEMGGKNCLIVDQDADLDEAVLGCVASAFGYQGQKCSALSRLIVVGDNYRRFLERLIAAADSLRIGPAEHPGNVLGPVISREAQQRILGLIEAGSREAVLAWKGKVPDDVNACYVPTGYFHGGRAKKPIISGGNFWAGAGGNSSQEFRAGVGARKRQRIRAYRRLFFAEPSEHRARQSRDDLR